MKEQNPSHAVILCAYVCVCVFITCPLSCVPTMLRVLGNASALIFFFFFFFLTKSPIFCAELKGQCGLILTGVLCGGSGLVVAHFSLRP